MTTGIDPFDVQALETSVNNSAVRVSTIWVSFLVFGLYLVIAAGAVTHRQLMLEEPVNLPVLNIALPLVAFFFLAPVLFVIFHSYVLLQALLLARTAAAYNEAVERSGVVASDRDLIRQRLANTLFAQMLAGSPREREGVLGAFLRLTAWVTLAIAPVLVLLTFEVKFLPYHSFFVTWSYRALISLDLAAVLLLWRGVLNTTRDITWHGLIEQPGALSVAIVLVLFAAFVVTYPGERHTNGLRFGSSVPSECNKLFFIGGFTDRLVLSREFLIDTEKLAKIQTATKSGARAFQSERTRSFGTRDLICARFNGADLRRADFGEGTILRGADLKGAQLQGASLSWAQLDNANLVDAQLEGTDLSFAKLENAELRGAQLEDAYLNGASLRRAKLAEVPGFTPPFGRDPKSVPQHLKEVDVREADLRQVHWAGADLEFAWLSSADLQRADLAGSDLHQARLSYVNLTGAQLQGADLSGSMLDHANLAEAQLQGANLSGAILTEANLTNAALQGAILSHSALGSANFSHAHVWRTNGVGCRNALLTEVKYDPINDPNTFIRQTVDGLPEVIKEKLVTRLRARLITDPDDALSEQTWRDCAAGKPQ